MKIETETVKDDEIAELKEKIKQLEGTIYSLKSSSNSWLKISEFFKTNKSIQKYYEEIVEECRRDNYFGMATMMIMTIEKLLEEIDDLRDDEISNIPTKKYISILGKTVEVIDRPKKELE